MPSVYVYKNFNTFKCLLSTYIFCSSLSLRFKDQLWTWGRPETRRNMSFYIIILIYLYSDRYWHICCRMWKICVSSRRGYSWLLCDTSVMLYNPSYYVVKAVNSGPVWIVLLLALYTRSADRFILWPSPYRAVNTFHLGYKKQSVYAVSGTSRCLFSDKYKTRKYSVGRAYSCWMLNCWCST